MKSLLSNLVSVRRDYVEDSQHLMGGSVQSVENLKSFFIVAFARNVMRN
jgi:hypothetical protein